MLNLVLLFWIQYLPAMSKAFFSKKNQEKKDQEKAWEETSKLLKILEKELKDKKYFGGETIGFVDIAASLIAHWVPAFEKVAGIETFTQDKFPRLYQWSLDFVSHAVVKEILPPMDKLIDFYTTYLETTN